MNQRPDDDFQREIESHLALETDRLIADGLPPDEAAAAARRRFGNATRAAERFHESRPWPSLWAEQVVQDLRYGMRGLARTPAMSLVTVAIFAVGIAASTVVAAQVHAVFLRDAPVAEPASLRTLSWSSPRRAFTAGLFRGPTWDARRIESFPAAIFRELRAGTASVADMACWRPATQALSETKLWRVEAVSGAFFSTLGVSVVAGRTLTEADDTPGAPLVALVHDSALLGERVTLHGHDFTVVGVLPAEFTGLSPLSPADVFVPYAADHLFPVFQRNAWSECRVVARLRAGTAPEQARLELEARLQQLIAAAPPAEPYEPPRLFADEMSARQRELQGMVTTPLVALSATTGVLLLILCANIGGLLFARGRARQLELATRLALGASRGRVVQQLLTESLLLSAIGGAAGIMTSLAFAPVLPRMLSALGGVDAVGISTAPDIRVLTFAVVLSGVCGVLFGLLPALMITRVDPLRAVKRESALGSPSRMRAGKAALVVQLALSMVVLVGAGLLVRTWTNLRNVPLGYEPERLLFVETQNPVGRPRAVVERALADLAALPGVVNAAASQWPVFNNATPRISFCIPEAGDATQDLDMSFVFPGFFTTWGIPIRVGRDIDDGVQPGAVVNETFVRRYYQGANPIGRMIRSGPCPGRTEVPIIGVVGDHIDRQRVERIPAVYLRYPRGGALYVTTYAVRTAGNPGALVPDMRRVIAAHGLSTVRDVRTGTDYRDGVMTRERLLSALLAGFATVALFIACLGLYGLLAALVTWRTPEIGVRVALGATRPSVLWLVLRESMVPVAVGIAAGGVAAVFAAQPFESWLFDVAPRDALTLAVAALALLIAAAGAALLPAQRAAQTDPLPALRCE